MSRDNFLSFLQQLLTMVDPDNECSVALAESILQSTASLAKASGKTDAITLRMMWRANNEFKYLVNHADEFKGKPGEYKNNEQKRRRLGLMLQPGC